MGSTGELMGWRDCFGKFPTDKTGNRGIDEGGEGGCDARLPESGLILAI